MPIPPAPCGTADPRQGRFRLRPTGFLLLGLIAMIGCRDSPIYGTYEVSMLIEGAREPIDATMILTTAYLNGRPVTFESNSRDDESTTEPNSCLIIPSNDPQDDVPRSVTYFETRVRSGEFGVPTVIYTSGTLRIEVTKLQFYGDAVGGEISFHDEEMTRPGRIIGDRQGDPEGSRCTEAVTKFNARIEELIRAAQRESERQPD